MTKIKVCGLTDKENILKVIKLGIDAVGFIMAESKRKVSLDKVENLTEGLPPFIDRVGVVVNPCKQKYNEIIKSNLFDYLQFHGTESLQLIKRSPFKNIKAISISSRDDLSQVKKYEDVIDYFLFDSKTELKRGGTGQKFNWEYLNDIKSKKPFILAGGLGPHNIKEALRIVDPAAVDLNSQIEISPGIKDINLLQETVDIIKRNSN